MPAKAVGTPVVRAKVVVAADDALAGVATSSAAAAARDSYRGVDEVAGPRGEVGDTERSVGFPTGGRLVRVRWSQLRPPANETLASYGTPVVATSAAFSAA